MKQIVIGALLAGVVTAIVLGIAAWNKPHPRVEDAGAVPITAHELYRAYNANEAAANTRYLNKPVRVTGTLLSQEKNQDGQLVAVLQAAPDTDDLLATGVMCTMREKEAYLPQGKTVTLKGFCTGYAGDIHLTDCIVAR